MLPLDGVQSEVRGYHDTRHRAGLQERPRGQLRGHGAATGANDQRQNPNQGHVALHKAWTCHLGKCLQP